MARFLKISKQIHLVGERFIWKPWGNMTYMLHWVHGKLKGTLVHPKDKPDKEDITECVYKVPCANCDKTRGNRKETIGVRLQEHKTECESKTKRAFTRSQRTASLAEINKSALTDHVNQENHTISWSKATVIDRKPNRLTKLIKEAIQV